MVLSERWRVADEQLLFLIEELRTRSPGETSFKHVPECSADSISNRSKTAPADPAVGVFSQTGSTTASSEARSTEARSQAQQLELTLRRVAKSGCEARKRFTVPELGLPPSPSLKRDASASSTAVLSPLPKAHRHASGPGLSRWVPSPVIDHLHRQDTIPCSLTGKRSVGAPSRHIKLYIEIPRVHASMSLWVDPNFPIHPPPTGKHTFAGVQPVANLPARGGLSRSRSAPGVSRSDHSHRSDDSDQEVRCLQDVISHLTGVPPWEQNLCNRGASSVSKGKDATLLDFDIGHGSTITLGGLHGTERDVMKILRSLGADLRERFPEYVFTDDVLVQLREPIVDSMNGYRKALKRITKLDGSALVKSIERMPSEYLLNGNLTKATKIIQLKKEPDELLQPLNDLNKESLKGSLLASARQAQDILKNMIASSDLWTAVDGAPERSETRGSHFADYVLDPGIKRWQRIDEKAKTKYMATYGGSLAYARVRDISRMMFYYDKCSKLVAGINLVKRFFDVIEIENRFSGPTALGWRDVTILIKIPLGSRGDFHIAELQLTHRLMVEARSELHKHWRTIRTMLPNICRVKPEDMNTVQCVMLNRLESSPAAPVFSRVPESAQKNAGDRIAWVSPRWQHHEHPRLVGTGCLPQCCIYTQKAQAG